MNHLNITFANNIINKQATIEDGLDQFLNAMFKKLLKYNNFKEQDFNLSNYINYKLNPPLVLQLQSDEAQITVVNNIVNSFLKLKIVFSSSCEKWYSNSLFLYGLGII